MDKLNFAALRTLFNDQRIERDGTTEEGREEPRLLNDVELRLAAGGDDHPNW